ncbi:hypothetical protein [Fibrobacter sp. UWH1]|uniref:hypothetical protein n=1 Tax=Fibrobacter sp. UWH1 TaxID=1964354 RepID=UPI000B51F5CE|nr:hypothetical protein [Fibrobacter sp. UWH1]OWV04409.1 hypothetical protein B7992_15900 [Fibrobacter sp. UWH1]
MNSYKTALVEILKNKYLPFILGIPLFFCLHHYDGIIGDARLYLLQTVYNIHPERFLNDPPFMYGNQDSYGIFTSIYLVFLKLFSVDLGSEIFCFITQFTWIVAAIYMVRKFTQYSYCRIWYIPFLFAFIGFFGYNMPNANVSFFRYVENFVCSRSLSFGFALFGLGFLFGNRKKISLSLFLVGSLIHPLTAGWCLPLWLFHYYPKTIYPIAITSLLLPLTYLLHKGGFDIYPQDWGECTQKHDVTYEMLAREIMGILYLGIVVPKCTGNANVRKLAKCFFWVCLIGLYWSATGGVGKHILLYQVQTWRVEWLVFISSVLFFLTIVFQNRFFLFSRKEFTNYDFAFVICSFAMFMPNYLWMIMLPALLLFLKSKKVLSLKTLLILLCIVSGILYIIQSYTVMLMQDLIPAIPIDIQSVFKFSSSIFLLHFVLLLMLCYQINFLFDLKTKVFLFVLVLAYCAVPQFLLIPIFVVIFVATKHYSLKKLYLKLTTFVVLLDCLMNFDYRESNIFVGFPKQTLYFWFLTLLFCAALFVILLLKRKKKSKIYAGFPMLFYAAFLLFFAMDGYEHREKDLIQAEKNIDVFWKETIFPQVENRGKIFYAVSGKFSYLPRVQFLTGAYFCETTHIGEPLFENQFREALKRDNFIFYKANLDSIAQKGTYHKFMDQATADVDFLVDHVNFLCDKKEISHLVSSLDLTEFKSVDSYLMPDGQEIKLYECR